VDAVNEKEEMFGTERLTKVVRSQLKNTAQGMVDAIYEELLQFQGGVERFDDETVVVLKVLESTIPG
jgi:sigma-B regulation protein RsbU (phosphoserine phosphatase)